MREYPDVYEKAMLAYQDPSMLNLARSSALTEAAGYGIWSRVREIIEFSRRAGFSRLGLAFCVGLRREAAAAGNIFRENGFTVFSVICKSGSVPKEEIGLRDEEKVRPGQFEAMCNPVVQAMILNETGAELNILLGLCVGHDSLFIKHSLAPVTVLAVKDRVLAHNPLGALYAIHYYHAKLKPAEKS